MCPFAATRIGTAHGVLLFATSPFGRRKAWPEGWEYFYAGTVAHGNEFADIDVEKCCLRWDNIIDNLFAHPGFPIQAESGCSVAGHPDHQFKTLLPPLALLAGFVFARIWRRFARIPVLLSTAIAATLLVPQGLRISERWRHVSEVVDVPATVAEYIGERVQPGKYIYVANYQPIIYFITGTRSPTRWALPTNLISPEYRIRLGIQLKEEMASIFGHQPAYVMVQTREGSLINPAYYRLLFTEYLNVDYELEGHISTIALYRRKNAAGYLRDPAGSGIGSIEE